MSPSRDILIYLLPNISILTMRAKIKSNSNMESLLEKLQLAQARLLRDVLASHGNDRSTVQRKLQELKETLEELELVAQAATRPSGSDEADAQSSERACAPTFYATYLLVLLLAENLYVSVYDVPVPADCRILGVWGM